MTGTPQELSYCSPAPNGSIMGATGTVTRSVTTGAGREDDAGARTIGMDATDSFGQWLKEHRQGRDLTQAGLAVVRAAFGRPATRLVTLTGPPGIGKIRLALAVAASLQPYPSAGSGAALSEAKAQAFADGICFVSLAPITDPDLVAGTVARAL